MAIQTVTSSQQRRFMELRRGQQPDPMADIGPVVAALRGLTSVAAEGAAKTAAEEGATRPPMEVKARVTNDGKTLYDFKNFSPDGDPAQLAQSAFDSVQDRFATKFMNLRRSSQAPPVDAEPVAAPEPEPTFAPSPQATVGDIVNQTARELGIPDADRGRIEEVVSSTGGLYRAERSSGRNPFSALLATLAVKALPGGAETATRKRIVDAQVQRNIANIGRAWGAAQPMVQMYQKNQQEFTDWTKYMSSTDERTRDNLMAATKTLAETGAPEGVDPDAYVAKLAGLGVLPEAFKPLVRQTIVERERKLAKEAEQAARAREDQELQRRAAERSEESLRLSRESAARSEEKHVAALAKVAEATVEKPYKFAIGDYATLDADTLADQIGAETADQPSLQRTIAKRLKLQSTAEGKLVAERNGLATEMQSLLKRLATQRQLAEGESYAPGAERQVAQLENREAAIRNRMVEIDALRAPLVEEIGKLRVARTGSQATPASGASSAPKVGDIKTFKNGKKGRWDGRGWVEVR